MKHIYGLIIAATMINGCESKPKIDLKTKVSVVNGAEPMTLGEVLQPFPKPLEAQIITSEPNNNCKMLKANGGAKVGNLTSYDGGKKRAPLYFIKEIKYVENAGTPQRVTKTAFRHQRAEVIDVIVTEIGAPVSLLLTSHDAALWVIHSPPNVKIKNINIINYEGGAVIAPQVNKSQINFLIPSRENRKCWKSPERYANAKEAASRKPANYKRTQADFKRYRDEEKSYKSWLAWVNKSVGRVKYSIDRDYRLQAALIGQAPSQAIEATPLGGHIYMDPKGGIGFWGTKKEAQANYPPPPKR